VLDPETGLFPCHHTAKDIGDLVVMVLRENACRKASLVPTIATGENGFISRNFPGVMEKFLTEVWCELQIWPTVRQFLLSRIPERNGVPVPGSNPGCRPAGHDSRDSFPPG
jgi:hypothetical protein